MAAPTRGQLDKFASSARHSPHLPLEGGGIGGLRPPFLLSRRRREAAAFGASPDASRVGVKLHHPTPAAGLRPAADPPPPVDIGCFRCRPMYDCRTREHPGSVGG